MQSGNTVLENGAQQNKFWLAGCPWHHKVLIHIYTHTIFGAIYNTFLKNYQVRYYDYILNNLYNYIFRRGSTQLIKSMREVPIFTNTSILCKDGYKYNLESDSGPHQSSNFCLYYSKCILMWNSWTIRVTGWSSLLCWNHSNKTPSLGNAIGTTSTPGETLPHP